MKFWSRLFLVGCLYSSAFAENSDAVSTPQSVRVVFKATVTEHILWIIPLHYSVDSSKTGRLASWSRDSLELNLDYPKGSRRALPTPDVKKFYAADGRQKALWGGAEWGTIAALPLAMLFSFGVPKSDAYHQYTVGDRAVAGVAMLGMGAAVGAVIGFFCKEDRWREVKRPDWPIAVQVSCRSGGPLLSLQFAF